MAELCKAQIASLQRAICKVERDAQVDLPTIPRHLSRLQLDCDAPQRKQRPNEGNSLTDSHSFNENIYMQMEAIGCRTVITVVKFEVSSQLKVGSCLVDFGNMIREQRAWTPLLAFPCPSAGASLHQSNGPTPPPTHPPPANNCSPTHGSCPADTTNAAADRGGTPGDGGRD